MSASASIKVSKSFAWRGGTRVYANRYHITNGAPADAAKWLAFSDAVVAAEKAQMHSGVTIVKTEGYDAGSDVPVYSKVYTTAGTASFTSSVGTPGEAAILTRYATSARTSKNHPLYLFNYYHGAVVSNVGPWDTALAAQVTAMSTYGAAWVAGFSDGSVTHKRCGPNGDVATGVYVNPLITHRDFPRG